MRLVLAEEAIRLERADSCDVDNIPPWQKSSIKARGPMQCRPKTRAMASDQAGHLDAMDVPNSGESKAERSDFN